jgi:hypothetical protein
MLRIRDKDVYVVLVTVDAIAPVSRDSTKALSGVIFLETEEDPKEQVDYCNIHSLHTGHPNELWWY